MAKSSAPLHVAKLPYGFTAEFYWDAPGLRTEWEPRLPIIKSARHRNKFLKEYFAARREFMTCVASLIGGNVMVVDADGRMEFIEPPPQQ